MTTKAANKANDALVFEHIYKRQPCTTVSDIDYDTGLSRCTIACTLRRLQRAKKIFFSVDHQAWMTTEDSSIEVAKRLTVKAHEHRRQITDAFRQGRNPLPDLTGLVEVVDELYAIIKKGTY